MAYCRWSSMHGECDLYVYANVSGLWTLHVASRKPRLPVPDHIKAMYPDWHDRTIAGEVFAERYMQAEKARRDWERATFKGHDDQGYWWLDNSEYRDLREIGKEAGTTIETNTPGEMADVIERLLNKGWTAPASVIEALRSEQQEMDNENSERD